MTTITLPVQLTVGALSVEFGELELGESPLPALAELLRAAADVVDRAQEVSPDGTA